MIWGSLIRGSLSFPMTVYVYIYIYIYMGVSILIAYSARAEMLNAETRGILSHPSKSYPKPVL